MKTILSFALLLLAASAHGAALKRAEFTKVVNDVKTLEEQKAPTPAKLGDVVQGKSSVTTGAQSRAELKFEDKTLTRLGANSVFSLDQGTRTVDLKAGVMLMQVPKQMGGAKVRTAAVTAAVTGTTLMVEYQPNGYVKIIVLEGEVEVFLNTDPTKFTTITAGDMLIMKPDAVEIPLPVQVDLDRLKRTSRLVDPKEFGALGNKVQLDQADAHQMHLKQKGDLSPTVLVIDGQGIQPHVETHLPRPGVDAPARGGNVGVRPGPNGPGGGNSNPGNPAGGASKFGAPGLLGGDAVIDNSTVIVTDPIITTAFSGTIATGSGRIFRPGKDGQGLGDAVFGGSPTRHLPDQGGGEPQLDADMRGRGPYAAFRFDSAHLIGAPEVRTEGGPKNLLLASDTDFTLSDFDPYSESSNGSGAWNLSESDVNHIVIASRNKVDWQSTFSLTSTAPQTLTVYTHTMDTGIGQIGQTEGSAIPEVIDTGSGDIVINAGATPSISLTNGQVGLHAARDLVVGSSATVGSPTAVEAGDVSMTAGRDIVVTANTTIKASKTMTLAAQGSIIIENSTQLRRLSEQDGLQLSMVAISGDVSLAGTVGHSVSVDAHQVDIESRQGSVFMDRVSLNADLLRVHTLATNGNILIGNSSLTAYQGISIYAEGSNGTVEFVASTTLAGPATIAGHTVQVDSGVSVNVTDPNNLNIHANVHNYNTTGRGNFTNNGTPVNFVGEGQTGPHKHDFNSRPPF